MNIHHDPKINKEFEIPKKETISTSSPLAGKIATLPHLKFKTLLITGVSSGLGYECLKHFAANGYQVWGTVTHKSKIPEIPEICRSNVHLLEMDITNEESVTKGVDSFLAATGGKIDMLINNAGQMWNGVVGDCSFEEVVKLFDVNYLGQIKLIDKILPIMKKQKSGKIIQIGSIAGETALPFFSHYSATKVAIERYIQSLRIELVKSGVQATCILPGYIKSLLHRNVVLPEQNEKSSFQHRFFSHVSKDVVKSLKNGMEAPSVAKKIFGITQKKSLRPKYSITAYPENVLMFFNKIIPTPIAEKIAIFYFKMGMKK